MADNSWNWRGTMDRGSFAVFSFVLLAIKYNLDRFLAWSIGDLYWTPLSYVHPFQHQSPEPGGESVLIWIAITAVPFVWVLTGMVVRRLRSLKAPGWLATLTFIPLLNLVFFAVLAVIPATVPRIGHGGERPRVIPQSRWGAAAMGAAAPLLPTLMAAVLAVHGFEEYGLTLFVVVPFASGLGAALVYGAGGRSTAMASVGVACMSMILLGLTFLVLALEGVMCLLMAAPIGFVLAALGGLVAHGLGGAIRDRTSLGSALLVLTLSAPVLMGVEYVDDTPPPTFDVITSILIDAPPEIVWEEVVAFRPLPEPTEYMFRSGIAYPTHAHIDGEGVGAIRYCEFSTGPFVEPIDVWDEPHRLAFHVSEHPPAMVEMSPWGEIDAPHVDNYFVSERGEFRLTPTESGGTLLEGTTWYHHDIWPAHYWRFWSDAILHGIHERVLESIAFHAESRT